MVRWSPAVTAAVAVLAVGALVGQCAGPPDAGARAGGLTFDAEQTAELLPGTWLREYAEKGVQVRRVLTLEPRGAFHEVASVQEDSGRVTQFVHEGTWLYDGTNLKRRYTLMNGKPPSRLNLPFATFQVSFDTSNEFTGVDNIHARTIHYRRVRPGTTP